MSVGPLKGKEVFVASPVCQKQRISFDKLCERMAGDSTVGDAYGRFPPAEECGVLPRGEADDKK